MSKSEPPPAETLPPPPLAETRGRLLAHVDHLYMVAERAKSERLPKIAAGILASACELKNIAERLAPEGAMRP